MKRAIVVLLSCIVLGSVFPSFSEAADVSIGASSWYSWWRMSNKNMGPNDTVDVDPGLLYGPLVSIRLSDDWSLSSVFLTGKFVIPDGAGPSGGDLHLRRFDSDTLLNYNLGKYFKVFGGFKFLGFTYSGGHNLGYGGGLGIGLTAPLSERFFLIGNLSAILLRGDQNSPGADVDSGFWGYGGNGVVSLAYYADSLSTTITLGYRGQFYRYDYSGGAWQNHLFHGPSLLAVYSFDI